MNRPSSLTERFFKQVHTKNMSLSVSVRLRSWHGHGMLGCSGSLFYCLMFLLYKKNVTSILMRVEFKPGSKTATEVSRRQPPLGNFWFHSTSLSDVSASTTTTWRWTSSLQNITYLFTKQPLGITSELNLGPSICWYCIKTRWDKFLS